MIALSQNLRMLVGKSLLLIPRTSELFWTSSEIIGCLLKNILRSSTKNWGTCRASHEDENLDKLTPLWYQNVKVKRSVFALRMMSDELSSWKVALYARYRQAQSALQRLLDERAQLQQYLIDTKRQVTIKKVLLYNFPIFPPPRSLELPLPTLSSPASRTPSTP